MLDILRHRKDFISYTPFQGKEHLEGEWVTFMILKDYEEASWVWPASICRASQTGRLSLPTVSFLLAPTSWRNGLAVWPAQTMFWQLVASETKDGWSADFWCGQNWWSVKKLDKCRRNTGSNFLHPDQVLGHSEWTWVYYFFGYIPEPSLIVYASQQLKFEWITPMANENRARTKAFVATLVVLNGEQTNWVVVKSTST